ncbi:MAG: diacylglycerol kinase [Planctomycetaceae bacterium]
MHTTSKAPNVQSPPPRRSAWRQRLVDAERGLTQGFRADSTLFVHFFAGSVLLASALVLGLTAVEWTVLILSMTVVLSAEMFHHVIRIITQTIAPDEENAAHVRRALTTGTAAVVVAILGAALVIGLLFGRRLAEMLAA